MSTPTTRLGEAEKQLHLAAEDLTDDRKATVAEQLSTLVRLFREGVDEPAGAGLIQALKDADAHPDMVAYARKARERGGTGILSSLQLFHENSGVHRMAEIGTPIEKTLWSDGAVETLDRHGNVDVTNTQILQEIVSERQGVDDD